MGLTSALNTSLNGLTLNETTIDVLGNNIANAGTNGFKASTVLFTTQLSRTLSVGSRPSSENGGTNPRQIGLGATTSTIVRDFTQGSVTNSTSPSDLAIEGDGFFVLEGADGNVFSRNGNFTLNSENLLVNAQGLKIQGYGVDDDFNLIKTQLSDIEIPLGDLNVAQQTQSIEVSGALLPTGTVGSQGSIISTDTLYDATTGLVATGATTLQDLRSGAASGGSSVTLFDTIPDELSFAAKKGGRSTGTRSLALDATTTVDDLMLLMNDTLGIADATDAPSAGIPGTPGVTITGGVITVEGNYGTVNDITMAVGDMIQTSDSSAVPLAFTKSQASNGESTLTDFIIFDSLGQAVNVKLSAVLESQSSTSTTFRYFVESVDDSDQNVFISSGLVTFDSNGKVSDGADAIFDVTRNNTAAVSPMQVTVDFRQLSGISSASAGSSISLSSQDGSDPGTLTNFVIDETGIINGVFDNGIIRTLGQVTLARFSNPQGLLESGSGTFREGVSSGPPFLATPGNFGAGTIQAGAIELSNTDIGRNLVDLIVASTNYRGNARVISSVQELVDELLILGR
ncbi:Flagellar hook protein FlgE [Polystyrenella longa]|uniref:Flagellar hook protein FlgE n=1 Tax=Polystyrenella longa TaxID=2528007 RepID=A0A518CIS4_9PLAN|nr:flagellar hook-basal body complex protein [Polystyrenella longa]QDU79121.1 Flagellar hook protein FlgE [Polystyrenella longa]